MEQYRFIVEPVATWSMSDWAVFPALFVLPAEISGFLVDTLIYVITYVLKLKTLPERDSYPPLVFKDYFYMYFNRFVLLPFLSWLIVTTVWNSTSIVYDECTIMNTLVAFLVVFSLSDLVYYTG